MVFGFTQLSLADVACPRALAAGGLGPHQGSISYPHYVRDQKNQLWREELTPTYDHVADMLVTSRVRLRSVPNVVRSLFEDGGRDPVPSDILAQMNLDPIGVGRVRMSQGFVTSDVTPVLITDLDGDLRVFNVSNHQPYRPKQKTFIKTRGNQVIRLAKFPLAFDVTTGRIPWKIELLSKDYVSPVTTPGQLVPRKDFAWMVDAGLLAPVELEHLTVGRGFRRVRFFHRHENIPVYVLDIAGEFLVIDEVRAEKLEREYYGFDKTIIFNILAAGALRAPKNPVYLLNGKTLVLKVKPHPDDPKFFTKGYSI